LALVLLFSFSLGLLEEIIRIVLFGCTMVLVINCDSSCDLDVLITSFLLV